MFYGYFYGHILLFYGSNLVIFLSFLSIFIHYLSIFSHFSSIFCPFFSLFSSIFLTFHPLFHSPLPLYSLSSQHSWQAVVLLPFIDEARLKAALAPLTHTLTPDERRMNALGDDVIGVSHLNPLFSDICALYSSNNDGKEGENEGEKQEKEGEEDENDEKEKDSSRDSSRDTSKVKRTVINPEHSNGLFGLISPDKKAVMPGQIYPSPMPDLVSDIESSNAMTAVYERPRFEEGFVFKCARLEGAKTPNLRVCEGGVGEILLELVLILLVFCCFSVILVLFMCYFDVIQCHF